MRKVFMLAVAVSLALCCSGAFAVTTMWLCDSASGTPIAGDAINVPSGGTVTLYAFLDSGGAVGNTFEMMVGYDTSTISTYGTGGAGVSGKLTLNGTPSVNSSFFDVFTTAGYASKQLVLNATGREASNVALVGRPFGFVARAAKSTNGAVANQFCFSFVLNNTMPAGGTQKVVLSQSAGGNSYCDAWKYGTTLYEDDYVLTVNSVSAQAKPAVGTAGKSLKDTLTGLAQGNYDWVLWGTVSKKTGSGFDIDDGSGVTVHVVSTSNAVVNGDYALVKGSLVVGNPPTLTATSVTKQN